MWTRVETTPQRTGRLSVALRIFIIVAAAAVSLHVAITTPLGANPDEAFHIAAFEWYETHHAPPAPNYGGVAYSRYGHSRVYNAEIVYQLFGLCGRVWSWAGGSPPPDRTYRVLNVALLPILLGVVMFWRTRLIDTRAIAGLAAAIPQLLYIFGYANSDAFAVFISTITLLLALRELERPSGSSWVLMGLVAGLAVASKVTAWPAAVLSLVAVAFGGVAASQPMASPRRRAARLAGVVALGLAVAAPGYMAPRLAAGDESWSGARERMAVHRAVPELNPRKPTASGFALRRQGSSPAAVVLDGRWWTLAGASLWAAFGFMNVFAPAWMYVLVFGGAAVLTSHNLSSLQKERALGRRLRSRLIAISAVVVALQIVAMIWHSWIIDYQPQGRYLLPLLLPLSVLGVGVIQARRDAVRWALLSAHLVVGWTMAWVLAGRVLPLS